MNFESFGSQPSPEGINLNKAKKLEEELSALKKELGALPADKERERIEMVNELRYLQDEVLPQYSKEIGGVIGRLNTLPPPEEVDKAA